MGDSLNILIAGSVESCSTNEEQQIAECLLVELANQGHSVDMFMLPYEPDTQGLPEQIAALHLLRIESVDLLITVGYPAMFLPYHKKSTYLLKTASMLYEYWDTQYGTLYNPSFFRIKEAIINAEKHSLHQTQMVTCGSQLLQEDLQSRHGIESTVSYYQPPSNNKQPNSFAKNSYVVTESDLSPHFRMEFIVDIVKVSKGAWNLKWYVPRTQIAYKEAVEEMLCRFNLNERVQMHYETCPSSVIKDALAYVTVPFMVRKIPSSFMLALEHGVPIVVPDDAGAILELSDAQDVHVLQPDCFAFAKCLDNISPKSKALAHPIVNKTISIENLARRLVQ